MRILAWSREKVLQLKKRSAVVPVTRRLPDPESYILVSFENFSLPDIATYRVDEDGSGAFTQVVRIIRIFLQEFLSMPGCHCRKRTRQEMEER